ncbi:unnamed protein product [Parascedosporium putredinis]|nr:unnamed protein product [Parascedosporium putredinis]CAI7987780.1 unnamed protein product [Parascedosporium putredinis]
MSESKSGAWSDADKAHLLMEILAQWRPTRGHIDWDKVDLNGRTKKANQQAWHKFMTELKNKHGESKDKQDRDVDGGEEAKDKSRKRGAAKGRGKGKGKLESDSESEGPGSLTKRAKIEVVIKQDGDDEDSKALIATPVKRRGRPPSKL